MSGKVDPAGWYKSTLEQLTNATLASVISEDIHNIEHYYLAQAAPAPVAEIMYISTVINKKPVLLRASNMPHTQDVFTRKFTVFVQKQATSEVTISTHGYGAVLPYMFIGGDLEIQFKDPSEEWYSIRLDIEAQKKECLRDFMLTRVPSDAAPLGLGVSPVIENNRLWSEDILTLFKERQICTVETHTNPSCMGRCAIRKEADFLEFAESVQCQFEAILNKSVRITCVFVRDDGVIAKYALPYNFYKYIHAPAAPVYPFPYSPYGTQQLELRRDFDVSYVDEQTLHCRTYIDEVPHFFTIDEKGTIALVQAMPAFRPRFRVWVGRAPAEVHEYGKRICEHPTHPIYVPHAEDYSASPVVDLNGYRMTGQPIRCPIQLTRHMPFVARTRTGIDVLDADTKRDYIDARMHKNDSTFKTTPTRPNVLIHALKQLIGLVKRSEDADQPSGSEDQRLLKALQMSDSKVKKAGVRKASNDGVLYETNCAEALRAAFPDFEILEGDIAIRRTFLGTEDKQYTGVDILVRVGAESAILIQCKRKDRVTSDDYDAFLRTFNYAVSMKPSMLILGVFVVHKPKITPNENFWELQHTPGVSMVCANDTNPQELVGTVEGLVNHFFSV
jgi:hypothetical protein